MEFPENSVPGVERCLDLNARYIEIDVQLTRDHEVILHHDRTLERCCGVPGTVHEATLKELDNLSFSEPDFFGSRFQGLPPARLGQVVWLCRERCEPTLFIEVKPVAVEQFGIGPVLDAVRKAIHGPSIREVLISYRPDLLEEARQSGWPCTGLTLNTWEQTAAEASVHEYLFCNVSRLPRSGELTLSGCNLGVYDVIDPALGKRLLQRGVDLVETFDLGGMSDPRHG
jgi:glycerophosphoryl diester phosphodiesterase